MHDHPSRSLSLRGGIGLLAFTAACWLADLGGLPKLTGILPHECVCLIMDVGGTTIHLRGFWTDLMRLGIFLIPVAVLVGWDRRWMPILGLTSGQADRIIPWTLAVTALSAAVLLLGFAVRVPLVSGFGFTLTDLVLTWQPGLLYSPLAEKLWRASVMAPLIEELGYRAVVVPALFRLGGMRVALFASGLIWAGLHLMYQAPLLLTPFYFFSGIVVSWMFLATRSIVPGLIVHAAFNTLFEVNLHLLLFGPENLVW